ncbi:hypothetical protein [Sphingomonas jinjuensis]|uniref:hypothetical protein n=1 Tax=Sphingomonas jinjuensis TaxID=535907 RepID=UPI001FECB0E5|nr:hypothetical protein [Sphingomonas jinjuensis]
MAVSTALIEAAARRSRKRVKRASRSLPSHLSSGPARSPVTRSATHAAGSAAIVMPGALSE